MVKKPTSKSASKSKSTGTAKPASAKAKPASAKSKPASTKATPPKVTPPTGAKATPATNPVPEGLQRAVDKIASGVDGRFVYGLPQFGLAKKMKLKLVALGNRRALDDKPGPEHGSWWPLATFKEERPFLTVHAKAPHAVGVYERGGFYQAWPTLAAFVAKVIDGKGKTPFDQLDKQLAAIAALIDNNAYAEALGEVEAILKICPPPPSRQVGFRDRSLARAYNLHGLALKGVDRGPEAKTAFELSARGGNSYAELNILDLLEPDPRAVIEHGLQVREDAFLDDYLEVWLARYLGFAHLDLGDAAAAATELKQISDGYGVKDPKAVNEQRAGLEKYIADGRPGAEIARPFLDWFKPRSYEVTAAEATANRAWWKRCPKPMRAKLLEEAKLDEDSTPTDAQLARCMDAESLNLDDDDGTFDDALLPLFMQLPRLKRLAFYGDPDSIAVLAKHPAIERLTINNDVIKGFAWPSRADRDLWKAAEAADRKGVEAALKAGASIGSRGDHGTPALMSVAMEHDVELCKLLITKGADPWAGSYGDAGSIYDYFGPDERKVLEAHAKAKGVPHPDDDPYRIVEIKREPRAATFELVTTIEGELDDGEPLLATWPADVQVAMETPKSDNKLYDALRLSYDTPIVGERIAAVLRGLPNIELLPVALLDHARKPVPGTFFVLNPLVQDCLVVDLCFPQWNHIDPDSITSIAAHVIDPARVGGAAMFRPDLLNSRPMIVTKELAATLAGFTGIEISYLKR